ncbi:MAG TPA: glycosyltransferase family 4 protein [Candidatus Polarisedimenticolia bacterium]|nr:glycosyltransferase family 4 protein [Candidatus Polarisedimenticolia bacterium]
MSGARPERTILFLSERSDLYGGGQRSLCDLSSRLRPRGLRPLAVVPGPGPLTDALEGQGTEWAALPLPPLLSRGGFGPLIALERLVRLARRLGADLLHSDSPRTAVYGGLAGRFLRRPHVWHVRASRPSSAVSDRLLVSLSDRIISVSRAASERSAAVRRSPAMRVVRTGLPDIHFLPRADARAALGLPPDPFVCGVVGRVEEDKGRDDALAALFAIRRVAPSALLTFLGPLDVDGRWAHTCSLRAAAAGAAGAVRLAGDRPDAGRLLRAFDLLLHPSRHEALPRVVIEALFAEVPVVASAVGGIPEIIEPGLSGLLVPSGDPDALGRAAARIASSPELGRSLATAGVARARTHFGIERMIDETTAVYDELLRPRQAPTLAGPGGKVGGRAREVMP